MTSPVVSLSDSAIKRDVVARAVGDETILLDLETGTYFTLNPVGALVWKGLENGSTREEILASVLDRFEVDPPTAAADIQEYLHDLISQGLVVVK